MTIKNTDAIAISKLLEDNNSKTQFFAIPKYQREYTWGKKEWSSLFNDVLENGKDYFLGSIISVCDDSISSDYPILEIIDGQQRMTTLSILLAVLYSKASAYKNILRDKEDDRYDKLRALMKQLVYKKNNDSCSTPRLEPQKDNSKDFNYVLMKCGLLENEEYPKNFGNRKISKAYQFFIEQIDSLEKEMEDRDEKFDKCTFLFDLIEKFNSAILVDIEVSSNKDAYMLFESLNHRGVPLSAIDLIKNHLIRISDRDGKDVLCYKEWQTILKYLTEEYSVQERFFRQFYNAFRTDLNAPFVQLITNAKTKYYLGPLATRTTLLGIYEKLIEKNYATLIDSLKKHSKIYSIIINNNEDECPRLLYKPLINLERIQGAPSYILLMYLLSKIDDLAINYDVVKKIVDVLITFFVRRNVTDFPNTRNLTKIFMECIDLISSKKGDEVYCAVYDKLQSESSTDDIFKNKLQGKIYEENVDAVRFLLSYYEESFFTKENEQNLWKRDSKNKFIFTIEHIFPEGERIPQHWIDMIADGDKEKAKEFQDKYVHTLGNLTLTGFNSNLSNKPFDEKKNLTDKEGNYIGYKNKFKLNELLITEDTWTIDKIRNRTDGFVNYFLKEFSF